MQTSRKIALLTLAVGVPAFLAGPHLWPPGADVPAPPEGLMPGYIGLAVIEALAFGFAVSFAVFGWSTIRDLDLGARWLNAVLFVAIVWFTGNWWIHDSLHIHVGLDMHRLLFIEFAFHVTMLILAVVLALGFLTRRGPSVVASR